MTTYRSGKEFWLGSRNEHSPFGSTIIHQSAAVENDRQISQQHNLEMNGLSQLHHFHATIHQSLTMGSAQGYHLVTKTVDV